MQHGKFALARLLLMCHGHHAPQRILNTPSARSNCRRHTASIREAGSPYTRHAMHAMLDEDGGRCARTSAHGNCVGTFACCTNCERHRRREVHALRSGMIGHEWPWGLTRMYECAGPLRPALAKAGSSPLSAAETAGERPFAVPCEVEAIHAHARAVHAAPTAHYRNPETAHSRQGRHAAAPW